MDHKSLLAAGGMALFSPREFLMGQGAMLSTSCRTKDVEKGFVKIVKNSSHDCQANDCSGSGSEFRTYWSSRSEPFRGYLLLCNQRRLI